MHVIVCADDKLGMCFAGRRQSQDRLLREDLLALTKGVPLWMEPYSAKQFAGIFENFRIAEDFTRKALPGEYCFCERQLPETGVESVILYRWNRHYPADTVFPRQWLQSRTLQESREFAGSSHETITREVYTL